MKRLPRIHPGEQLREEFMVPRGLSPARLAIEIGVSAQLVNEIVEERRGVSGEVALRLARYFGTSAEFWLDMQRDFELEAASLALGDRLHAEVTPETER